MPNMMDLQDNADEIRAKIEQTKKDVKRITLNTKSKGKKLNNA